MIAGKEIAKYSSEIHEMISGLTAEESANVLGVVLSDIACSECRNKEDAITILKRFFQHARSQVDFLYDGMYKNFREELDYQKAL